MKEKENFENIGKKKEKFENIVLPDYKLDSIFAKNAYENFKYMKQFGNFEEDEIGARELTGMNETEYTWTRLHYKELKKIYG